MGTTKKFSFHPKYTADVKALRDMFSCMFSDATTEKVEGISWVVITVSGGEKGLADFEGAVSALGAVPLKKGGEIDFRI